MRFPCKKKIKKHQEDNLQTSKEKKKDYGSTI